MSETTKNSEKRKEAWQKNLRLQRAIEDTLLLVLESEEIDLPDKLQAIKILKG